MIKAEELRIGNYFRWDKLASMGVGHTKVDLDNIKYYKFFEPIQLTEEILLKCGWVENGTGVEYRREINNLHVDISFTRGSVSVWGIFNEEYTGESKDVVEGIYLPIPKSLHRFQNLIYELTNEELQIEL